MILYTGQSYFEQNDCPDCAHAVIHPNTYSSHLVCHGLVKIITTHSKTFRDFLWARLHGRLKNFSQDYYRRFITDTLMGHPHTLRLYCIKAEIIRLERELNTGRVVSCVCVKEKSNKL